ncbi:MAG: hypothetical protein NT126_06390 [Bacteroidetes bacterium]|nr:hypothetical protein [Bacteroidota bacterium]
MKRILVIILSVSAILVTSVSAQTKSKSSVVPPSKNTAITKDPDIDLYNRAIQYGDYDVAKHALYTLMIRNPDRTGYLDSLVALYYNLNAYPQCVLTGNAYLEKDTSNLDVMEMVAISNVAMKRNKEALALYEKMYLKTGKIYYAYHLAVQQYVLKRIGECNQMIDIVLNDPQSAKENIPISSEDGRQNVPLKAAALNLRGIIFNEINQKEKAKEYFEAALQVFPDFSLAKKNLDTLAGSKETETKKEK